MIIITSDEIKDKKIVKTIGMVKGSTIRARHLGKDILAAFRNVVGGEVAEYTKMMAEAREQALDRMITTAESLGADGITGIRFTSATVMSGAAEIVVYGTAVKFK